MLGEETREASCFRIIGIRRTPQHRASWRGGPASTHASTSFIDILESELILKLHILGIAGTFMGGVAAVAGEHGRTVPGRREAG